MWGVDGILGYAARLKPSRASDDIVRRCASKAVAEVRVAVRQWEAGRVAYPPTQAAQGALSLAVAIAHPKVSQQSWVPLVALEGDIIRHSRHHTFDVQALNAVCEKLDAIAHPSGRAMSSELPSAVSVEIVSRYASEAAAEVRSAMGAWKAGHHFEAPVQALRGAQRLGEAIAHPQVPEAAWLPLVELQAEIAAEAHVRAFNVQTLSDVSEKLDAIARR